MVESLLLGFRDMFRNKRLSIVFGISLITICFIVISASSSLFRELNSSSNVGESSKGYTVVPISNDMSSNGQLVNEINKVLNKGGKSFFPSEKISSQIGFPALIVIDKAFNESFDSEEQISEELYAKIYAKSYIKQKINFDNVNFPEPTTFESTDLIGFDERIFENFSEDEVVIFLLKTNQLDKWIETSEGMEIIELVENIRFSELDEREGMVDKFEAILEDSFLFLQSNSYQTKEVSFIVLYVYPVVAFLILSLVVAFIIMYVTLFKKLYREYSIHLITGATLKHIFVRNSIFIVTLVLVCFFCVFFLNGFRIDLIFWIILVFLSLVFVVFEVILYIVLKRKNLSMTLRGDY